MMFRVIGRMDGKHRIMTEEGKQVLLNDADLKKFSAENKKIGSQDRFPHEEVQLTVVAGGNPAYDLAFAQLVKRLEALESYINALDPKAKVG